MNKKNNKKLTNTNAMMSTSLTSVSNKILYKHPSEQVASTLYQNLKRKKISLSSINSLVTFFLSS